MHYRMFNCIPGLYPQDGTTTTAPTLWVVTIKTVSRHRQCPPGTTSFQWHLSPDFSALSYLSNNKNLYFKTLPTNCSSSCGKTCLSDLKTQLRSLSTLLPNLKPSSGFSLVSGYHEHPHCGLQSSARPSASDPYFLVLPLGLCTSWSHTLPPSGCDSPCPLDLSLLMEIYPDCSSLQLFLLLALFCSFPRSIHLQVHTDFFVCWYINHLSN